LSNCFFRLSTLNNRQSNSQEFPTMMAKMFYTLEETKGALAKNEEEIKQLTREGRLREFRDGPRLMFKADQVEALKAELGGGGGAGGRDQIDIGVSDTGAGIPLIDSRGGSASGIALIDSATGTPTKDDTALAADLGLSGSMGGVPSPGRPGSGSGLAGSQAGRSGISVFTPDEAEYADPSAQTNVSTGMSSGLDQVTLEGTGSGSGLLDLTRERDDTSLGVVLDEISPHGSRGGSRAGSAGGSAAGSIGGSIGGGSVGGESAIETSMPATPVARPRPGAVQVFVEATDKMTSALGGASLGAAVFVVIGLIVLIGAAMGVETPVMTMIQEQQKNSPYIVPGAGAGLAVIGFIFGLLLGKTTKSA
jgi:hypothetical protein